jgi:hypothetical protein
MKKLLYYNPNIVAQQNDPELPGVSMFINFFRIYNPSVVFVDRTETIAIPVHVQSLFPVFRKSNREFEDICNERAVELLARADSLGVKMYVMFSGGIDSTLVLVSLLKHATEAQKKNITVLLSEESIIENPNFYRDHIYGKLHTESSGMFGDLLGGKHLLVSGELNDQLFGSDMVGKFILRFGAPAIHESYSRDKFSTFFQEKLNDMKATAFYLDLFETLKSAAPIPIVTNHDYLWWINFSLKWQAVFMRVLSYASARNVVHITPDYLNTLYVPFFCTDEFQIWSLNNLDKRIKDSWSSYKWVCKDIIYDYTKDADYRDNKIKRGSLYHLIVQRPVHNFIDEHAKFYSDMQPAEYYNSKNDFV